MAKKITDTQVTTAVEEVKEAFKREYIAAPAFTNKAFSIQYGGDKLYEIVQIEFNEQGTASEAIVVEGNLDIYEAQNAFRTHVINAGLFDRKDM